MFPVEEVIPGIAESLARNRTVVLRAPPGSGKTTCVPPALLNAPFLQGKKILMLEPRRLAARSCAAYIASRLGEPLGETVGFQVRLERKISARTRLEIVTEGLLAQRLVSDPELSDVGLIIFDEFHERSLQCDLGFAMALDVRRALRDDLRLLVMSATLDVESIAAHLGDADIHTAEARMYPVETKYLQIESTAPISAQMAGAVKRALAEPGGDILCFLPGEGEIRRCEEDLRADGVDRLGGVVMPLYGALPKEEQDAVLRPLPSGNGKRKVVLATSIAETSLTIEGVTTVIDSGLMRVSRFSASSGMNRLETLRLTRDRAEQRRGRAGRVCAGTCLRLWTEAQDRLLLPAMKAEIMDADLAPTVLTAATWGTTAIDGLPWLTPPPAANWENAKSLLRMLGALDAENRITDRGRRMARLAAHPRLANMMLYDRGAAYWAAIIEEGTKVRETDISRLRPTPRMLELARRWGYERGTRPPDPEVLAFAFPDRIARNRGNGTFQMTCGRGAFLERTEVLATSPYLVLCDLDDRGGDAKIRLAAVITEDAIEEMFADQIADGTVTEWDRRTESVRAVRQRRLGRMVLAEGGQSKPDEADVQTALFAGIRQKGAANLPCWTPGIRQLQARINFLHRVLGDWPDVSDKALEDRLEDWFAGFTTGMSRWTHLERLDLAVVLDFALSESSHDRRELDRLAPVKMEVPSGSMMTIHYEEAEPFVAVRLQECFGLQATPKVAGGRVPIVMHLLSPAQRPVQVTKDLAGFWQTSYALVRKDMRGRYPKHYWPEDPATAVATRRVRPRPDQQ
ncbi:MAG: ATP-dependent helicase HrpB [bacterium]|nr:ATP-dependent helicase HrpB [bacterium]